MKTSNDVSSSRASWPEPRATPIPGACRMLGVRRSTVYNLINARELEAIKIGKRRLVLIDSIHRFIAAKAAEAKGGVA